MFIPDVNSSDMYKMSLLTLYKVQRHALSSSYIKEAQTLVSNAATCKTIAIGSLVLTLGTMLIASLSNNTKTANKEDDKESWSRPIGILSFVATVFFAYQYASNLMESERLKDLSEFIIEWVPETQ